MLAISLWQPWATLAAVGLKEYETRSWCSRLQGLLAIHASKHRSPAIRKLCLEDEHLCAALLSLGFTYDSLPRGGVVGVVRVGEAQLVPASGLLPDPHQLSPQQRAFGDFTPGRYAWPLTEARALPSLLECRGQQQLWQLPDLIRDQVYEALARALPPQVLTLEQSALQLHQA